MCVRSSQNIPPVKVKTEEELFFFFLTIIMSLPVKNNKMQKCVFTTIPSSWKVIHIPSGDYVWIYIYTFYLKEYYYYYPIYQAGTLAPTFQQQQLEREKYRGAVKRKKRNFFFCPDPFWFIFGRVAPGWME